MKLSNLTIECQVMAPFIHYLGSHDRKNGIISKIISYIQIHNSIHGQK